MDKIQQFTQKYNTRQIPASPDNNQGEPRSKIEREFQPGWTIKVFQKIKEGEKERLTPFEGIVIAKKHGKEAGGTFTVRKIISGVGVEKIFPIHSPTIERIEILKKAKVRRAKLYYLRYKSRKETRRKIKSA